MDIRKVVLRKNPSTVHQGGLLVLDCWVWITTKSILLRVRIIFYMKVLSPFVEYFLHRLVESIHPR